MGEGDDDCGGGVGGEDVYKGFALRLIFQR